jgi:predicted DCC family thiol-disulfide oxidoreductase YuxK
MQQPQYKVVLPRPGLRVVIDLLFYDGTCGLCHRTVRFVIAHDPDGERFRFAPLDGPTFRTTIPESSRIGLPDSIVLRTADGSTLTRYAAVLHIGRRIGGFWATLANIGWIVPRWLGDLFYDGVARIRKRLFSAPTDTCPVTPVELRARFEP